MDTKLRKKKVFIKSFGCQMNQYDSSRISDLMKSTGEYEDVDDMSQADLVVLNTCSIREKAEKRVFDELGRIRAFKKNNNELLVAVGGCVGSQEGTAIVKWNRGVDLVFGPQTLHRLPDMIRERQRTGISQVDVRFPEIEKFDCLPPPAIKGISAFVSIMEGCSKYCSFCIVPYTRGEEISRPVDDVLKEIRYLLENGVKEVTLLGQNVNAYRGNLEGELIDFAELLAYISILPGLERLRYMTSHPREMTSRLIESYSCLPQLASHVHLPVQSGSDRILMAMRRGHTVMEYKSIVRRLRNARPDICISTDIIVGFPGETEEDFQGSLALAEEIGFDHSYSFAYSRRPGTPAARMPDQVDPEVQSERLQRLQSVLRDSAHAITRSMRGTTHNVLLEAVYPNDMQLMWGKTDNNRVVRVPVVSDKLHMLVKVEVLEVLSHHISGKLVVVE